MRCIVFGAGAGADEAWPKIEAAGWQAVAFADNNPARQGGEHRGLPVLAPADLARTPFDLLVLASTHWHQMLYQAVGLGVPLDKIVIISAAWNAGESFACGVLRRPELAGLDIEENLLFFDAYHLGELARSVARPGARILEIGSWKGMSSSVLAREAAAAGARVYCVDTFQGSEDTWQDTVEVRDTLFGIFRTNMHKLGYYQRVVFPLVMGSLDAALLVADASLDMVFIDADHRYLPFLQDLRAWLPKVRPGGILCGHDCDAWYSQLSAENRACVEANLDQDFAPCLDGNNIHPGIPKALYEVFADRHTRHPYSSLWSVRL
jgi:SAM-dependent methyltransferase